MAVKGVKFEAGPNELQRAADDGEGSDGETVDGGSSSSSAENVKLPERVTTRRPLGATEEKEADPEEKPKAEAAGTAESKMEEVGVSITKEELLKQRKHCLCWMSNG